MCVFLFSCYHGNMTYTHSCRQCAHACACECRGSDYSWRVVVCHVVHAMMLAAARFASACPCVRAVRLAFARCFLQLLSGVKRDFLPTLRLALSLTGRVVKFGRFLGVSGTSNMLRTVLHRHRLQHTLTPTPLGGRAPSTMLAIAPETQRPATAHLALNNIICV